MLKPAYGVFLSRDEEPIYNGAIFAYKRYYCIVLGDKSIVSVKFANGLLFVPCEVGFEVFLVFLQGCRIYRTEFFKN